MKQRHHLVDTVHNQEETVWPGREDIFCEDAKSNTGEILYRCTIVLSQLLADNHPIAKRGQCSESGAKREKKEKKYTCINLDLKVNAILLLIKTASLQQWCSM